MPVVGFNAFAHDAANSYSVAKDNSGFNLLATTRKNYAPVFTDRHKRYVR